MPARHASLYRASLGRTHQDARECKRVHVVEDATLCHLPVPTCRQTHGAVQASPHCWTARRLWTWLTAAALMVTPAASPATAGTRMCGAGSEDQQRSSHPVRALMSCHVMSCPAFFKFRCQGEIPCHLQP